jgi:hypothetical protein
MYSTIIKIKRDGKFATTCCSPRSDKGDMNRGSYNTLKEKTGVKRGVRRRKFIPSPWTSLSMFLLSFKRKTESRFYKALTGVQDVT